MDFDGFRDPEKCVFGSVHKSRIKTPHIFPLDIQNDAFPGPAKVAPVRPTKVFGEKTKFSTVQFWRNAREPSELITKATKLLRPS